MRASASVYTLLIFTFAFSTSGCETTDKALTAAGRVARGQSGRVIFDLAAGKDPAQTAKKRFDQYARDPEALLRDLREAKKDFEAIIAVLGVNVGKTWGKKEVQLPERKKYVKYTQNYKSRAIVDFDSGEILVETLDDLDLYEVSRMLSSQPSSPRKIRGRLIYFLIKKSSSRVTRSLTSSASSLISKINPYAQRRKPSRSPPISSKRDWTRGWSIRTGPRKRPTMSRSRWCPISQ